MNRSRSGVVAFGLITIVIAAILILGPLVIPAILDIKIAFLSIIITEGFGVFLFIIGASLIAYTKLYQIATPSMAFVRTGHGGERVVIDGGCLVVPVLHSITHVSLSQVRIDMQYRGDDGLLTQDYLRTDIQASFYVNVPKEEEKVLQAARSMARDGGVVDKEVIAQALTEKFASALRSVATEMDIIDLLSNRQKFQQRVKDNVSGEIASNGLALDTVTLSKLDQTPPNEVSADNNIFDAQGQRRASEIIENQRIERNKIKLNAQRTIEADTVENQKALNSQAVEKAQADAERDRQIAILKAQAEQEAATAAAEQNRLTETAQLRAAAEIAEAAAERLKREEVAREQQEQAVAIAMVEHQKAQEVADRARQAAVAQQERELAEAEAQLLLAQAERQAAQEQVRLVQVESDATRSKIQAVIQAESSAKQREIDEKTKADVNAYTIEAQATAQQKAAERLADARMIEAKAAADARKLESEAEADALTRRAEGEKAQQMVPVEVEARRVEIKQAEVEVERQQLEAQSEHEAISRDLRIQLAGIEAERDVRIAQAEAQAQFLAQAQISMFGTAEDVTGLLRSHMQGQRLAGGISSFINEAPDQVKAIIDSVVNGFANAAEQKGISVDRTVLEQEAHKAMTNHQVS